MSVNYLDRGSPDGIVFGVSTTNLLSFYGGTPVNQPDAQTTAYVSLACSAGASMTTIILTATVTGVGWGSIDALLNCIQLVANLQIRCAELESKLEEINLIAAQ